MKVHFQDENAIKILSQYLRERIFENTIIICIGTDRCIGDALGPIVGNLLTKMNFKYPVYGTLKYPIHAVNLKDEIKKIKLNHKNPHIIAVDACLGEKSFIGNIQIRKGPIFPGKGVGKILPSLGDLSVVGIVDKYSYEDFFPIHSIRLNLVMEMAEVIVKAFLDASKE
ncbi:spore protease YyaC [Caminicella sporogenes]|nr:spore protease YyaC [Caminicella sporogenes]